MIRYLIAALALLSAAPAAAQSFGCASVPSNRVATSRDAVKLRADIDCLKVVDVAVDTRIATREKRLAELAAPPKPVPPVPIEPPKIASNFDRAPLLVPTWGSGDIAPSAAPDVVGAFRFHCTPGPLGYVDPIVFPGLKTSHLHQFFGNTAVSERSTYESLRTTGDSTCGNALNRSAYWVPAMLDGQGSVVIADYAGIYYKRYPESSLLCRQQGVACRDTPRGLRFVFGFNMLDHLAPHTGSAWFNCDGPTATSGHFKDIVEAAVGCPVGNRLGMLINSPDCWNGKDLDSPDHRSHIAYAAYNDQGKLRCPTTHPYVIPTFTMGVWYTVDANLDRSGKWSPSTKTWHLSSDVMPGMDAMRPGSTVHADWFGAWDDDTMDAWHANCIDKLLNCSGGDLGDGTQIKGAWLGQDRANPHVVPVPKP